MDKDFVILWTRYEKLFELYSDEEVGRIVRAMMAYRATGEAPDFTGNERFVWPAIQADIDRAQDAREKRTQRNAANGAKGGRPRKSNSSQEETSAKEADAILPASADSPETNVGYSDEDKTEKTHSVSPVSDETEKRQIKRERERKKEIKSLYSAPPKSPNHKTNEIREVKSLYRSICVHLLPLSEEPAKDRDKAVSRLLESRDLDACAALFKRAEASRFLRGESRSRWKAGFDWLLKPDNIAKLLEGQYDDGAPSSGQSYDLEELEEYWKNNVPTL